MYALVSRRPWELGKCSLGELCPCASFFPISGWPRKKTKPGGCLVSSALTICMEISVKNFCQMVLVFFFGPEESIEMYHLQNTGTFFPGSSNPNIYGTKKR